MDDIIYQIFEPDPSKKHIPYNWGMFAVWSLAIIMTWLIDYFLIENDFLESFRNIYLMCSVLLSIYLIASGLWTYRPLKGSLGGFLKFKNDSFDINGETFRLADLTKFDMHGEDHYGLQTRKIGLDFSPGLSQGVANFIEFSDRGGLTRKVYFKQIQKNQYKDLAPFIIVGIQKGKIPFLRGISLLKITEARNTKIQSCY